MVGVRHARAFHSNTDEHGRPLAAIERERLLQPYLPREPNQPRSSPARTSPTHLSSHNGPRFHHRQRIRPAVRHMLHSAVYNIIHFVFSIYIRLRQLYHAVYHQALAVIYYHHRTPELIRRDVKNLSRLPKHCSVILSLPPDEGKKDGLETLLNDVCELAAWSASAGIPMISIYERTGILKASLPHLHRRISRTLASYYGATSPSKPTISLRAPNMPSYSPPHSPEPQRLTNGTSPPSSPAAAAAVHHLTILLIDASDGRQTLVDLTKTLAEMAQHGKLSPADISSDLIDAEISESVMGEPDLLVVFGNKVVLKGYPPWQVRLSEIFYAQDNVGGVGYHIFLRALFKYAKAEFRLGR